MVEIPIVDIQLSNEKIEPTEPEYLDTGLVEPTYRFVRRTPNPVKRVLIEGVRTDKRSPKGRVFIVVLEMVGGGEIRTRVNYVDLSKVHNSYAVTIEDEWARRAKKPPFVVRYTLEPPKVLYLYKRFFGREYEGLYLTDLPRGKYVIPYKIRKWNKRR